MPTPEAKRARIAQQVRVYRAVGLAGKPRARIPRQQPPNAITRDYARELLKSVELARTVTAPLLAALPALLESAAATRHDTRGAPRAGCHWCAGTGTLGAAAAYRLDVRAGACGCVMRADVDEAARVQALIDQAQAALAAATDPAAIQRLARLFAEHTQTYQRIQLARQVHAALGLDVIGSDRNLARHVDGFVVENVALIKDIPLRITRDVELTATRAVASGTRWPELAKDLEKRFGYGEDRAKLIARDQVGKLYGQINAQRQRDLGITRFVWRTSHDERVRDEHAALDGEVFEYSSPPSEGLPGEAIQCRCHAEPVFDDLLGDLTA